ncbi:MAG: DUF2147 domain-containing protein [Hyphomicrobiales bacterium]|nr:MAG: DUF2147 domain-containing protein [Hyphomicrobiales bacterium]
MIRGLIVAGALLAGVAMPAIAAEPIEGNWRTQAGSKAEIKRCGGSFCVTLKSGAHAGKRIGKMSGSGAKYSGEITDPKDDKTYSGSAKVSGDSLKMKGCVMAVFCKTQTWKRL